MVDVHDGMPKDGFAVPLRLHNVLLALAGRLDDSALSDARELVARSHLDEAAELAVGALIAGRIPVRPAEQRELGLVLELSRSDPALAEDLTVGESGTEPAHRFSGADQPDRGMAEALDRILQVLPDLRSVHAVWRNTPAGAVPGPLPQRVVLIEIGPEAHPPAVAFRVDDALRRAGIHTVVEVTGPGAERTGYHEAALAAGTPVWLASDRGGTPVPAAEPPHEPRAGRARSRAVRTGGTRPPAHAVEPDPEPVEIPRAREDSFSDVSREPAGSEVDAGYADREHPDPAVQARAAAEPTRRGLAPVSPPDAVPGPVEDRTEPQPAQPAQHPQPTPPPQPVQPPPAVSEAQPRQQAPYPPQQAFPQAPDAAPAPDTAVPDADALSGSVSERPSATTGTPPGPGPGTQARPQHGAAPGAAEHDSGQELESAVESDRKSVV